MLFGPIKVNATCRCSRQSKRRPRNSHRIWSLLALHQFRHPLMKKTSRFPVDMYTHIHPMPILVRFVALPPFIFTF